ncbi:ATP-binding protein [Hahella sp. CR1]|uniref:ATP-binding protein n=1 Tax=Hahella sp. CR1 TaxID=2992807 RepID=UPI00244223DF|nr:ATP-binding protein [Hahella sp. CR1]MDG9670777.1 ATP-binding protein [Hahella sp. CR1]
MSIDWNVTPAAIWRQFKGNLRAVREIDPVRFDELLNVDRQKAALRRNTERFLAGKPANNALLWGSRGTGKSSLIKAMLNEYFPQGLRVIEVDKDDLIYLPEIVDEVRDLPQRFIIFCDDLSFEAGEKTYKVLKSVLEGSIELPPKNVLIYATSNRRHLMPEYMSENLETKLVNNEIHQGDSVEEKVSLSDRFGLWLSFYPFNQDSYLDIIDHYFHDYTGDREALHRLAIQFATSRGGRSGRVAFQFYKQHSEN